MRSGLVQPARNLTPVGEWLAARVPHVDSGPMPGYYPDGVIPQAWRLYGFAPHYRRPLLRIDRRPGVSGIIVFECIPGRPWLTWSEHGIRAGWLRRPTGKRNH
jgi:hypothetical protein